MGCCPGRPSLPCWLPAWLPEGAALAGRLKLAWDGPRPAPCLPQEAVPADDTFDAHVRKLVPAFAASPFPLPSRALFAAARSGQGRAGRARRKRTLDGEDRRGTLDGKGKGARASAGAVKRGGAPTASARKKGGFRVEEPCARDTGFSGDAIKSRSRMPVM
jgi:hypothetical protein